MRILSPLLVSKPTGLALTVAAIIVFILFAANFTITNAQQQQQQQQQLVNGNQPTEVVAQNATLFENQQDSFRVHLPEGWVIHDVNNTGFTLAAEVLQGYGILAQLCPQEQEGGQRQQEEALNNRSTTSSCQQQQAQAGEVIHIIRYPNMGSRVAFAFDELNNTIPDSIVEYEINKLQEVGYRNINIINSTDRTVKIHYVNATAAEILDAPEGTVPARLLEITYSTDSDPSETRRGYFILVATNATPPNPETVTGYSIFYESVRSATEEEPDTATTPSGTLGVLPAEIRQVFDSFELIPSEEVRAGIFTTFIEERFGNQTIDAEEQQPEDGGDDNGNGEAEDE